MDNKLEILLVNGYAPKQRSISDTALENSLAMLRTYLENNGVGVEVADDLRISGMAEGVPFWCRRLLKTLTKIQLNYSGNRFIARSLLLAAWPLHALALERRRARMRGRIQQIVAVVKARQIPFLGIKLWYGDAYAWGLALAAEVRRQCPETVIIAGGPQVKVYGELVDEEASFDITVMGPGEEILEKLVKLRRRVPAKAVFLKHVRRIFGGTLLQSGGYAADWEGTVQQLANLTVPRYRAADLADKLHFHTIVDGMGCGWNKCNFCSHTRCAVPFTPRPVADIVREIESMLHSGVAFFRFSSSATPPVHGRRIASAILAKEMNIRYSMFIRAANADEDLFTAYRIMIRAGLRAVFMGGETGHDAVNRDIMNKGATRKNIIDTIAAIRLAADAEGLPCRVGLSLIYPCPVPSGITLEEVYQANVALIDATLPDTVIVNPPGPFPGTKWFSEADRFGFGFTGSGEEFARKLMRYEYSNYKPAELWQSFGFTLQGMDGLALLKETGRLRAYVAGIGIPSDISDEYLMMTEAIGLRSRLDMMRFKRDTLIDIISGGTEYTRQIAAAVNEVGRCLAASSLSQAACGDDRSGQEAGSGI